MSLYSTVGASSIGPVPGTHPLPPPPSNAPSRKRKEREYDGSHDPNPNARPNFSTNHQSSSSSSSLLGPPRPPYVRPPQPPPSSDRRLFSHVPNSRLVPAAAPTPPAKPGGNRLLMAGYLAHEFLSHGTLFGCPYGTTTAQAAKKEEPEQKKRKQQYEEVAGILWSGGVHVPGVINPTQLGGWLQKLQDK